MPWFPFKHKKFVKYAVYANVPRQEEYSGIQIYHPRYPVFPKIGMNIAPLLLAGFTYQLLKKIERKGYNFDLIDAHYFYPDGVAAAILGNWLDKPVMITARGSDINLIPKYYLPRKMIKWAAHRAKKIAAVSESLKCELAGLGLEKSEIEVFRNGVDLNKFRPLNRTRIRQELNLSKFVLLSVGNLIELKGHHLVIQAMNKLPDSVLMIVGEGEMRHKLEKLALQSGVGDRVRFLDNVSQSELCKLYNAADVLVLASSREGMANVLLESLACGTPVIATNVGGNREVVQDREVGLILKTRSVEDIVSGIRSLKSSYPSRDSVRKYAETLSWSEISSSIKKSFSEICMSNEF